MPSKRKREADNGATPLSPRAASIKIEEIVSFEKAFPSGM
jgi:hypothetical protein